MIVWQRGEVSARSDWTVERLREELEQKFPGKIPASLQRLFKGTQLLQASMTLEEVSEVKGTACWENGMNRTTNVFNHFVLGRIYVGGCMICGPL